MFWKKRGGGLARQPVGPPMGTATMTAEASANRVDLESFHDVGRSGVHKRAQTLLGYFVPD